MRATRHIRKTQRILHPARAGIQGAVTDTVLVRYKPMRSAHMGVRAAGQTLRAQGSTSLIFNPGNLDYIRPNRGIWLTATLHLSRYLIVPVNRRLHCGEKECRMEYAQPVPSRMMRKTDQVLCRPEPPCAKSLLRAHGLSSLFKRIRVGDSRKPRSGGLVA